MKCNAFCENSTLFPRMCDLTGFVDTAQNVRSFLWQMKLVSSFIKEINEKSVLKIYNLS